MSTMIHEPKSSWQHLDWKTEDPSGASLPTRLMRGNGISVTHYENIRTFNDLSLHLELETKRLKVSKAIKYTKSRSAYVANNDSHRPRGPKHKNYAQRQDSGNGPTPKKVKNTKHKRGKRSGKGKDRKCFNCNKEGHFTHDCTEPRKILSDFNYAKFLFSLILWLLTHIHIGLLIQEQLNTSREAESGL